ncbi:zinc ribbon domain-containing protein [Streptomyces sp. NPDC005402]|uniref:zinc ribbon domain-containing protein n=1 Tax=Streptomyces sp. NPDC005402 TaxID=3155338 RepID=UPI0033BD5C1B
MLQTASREPDEFRTGDDVGAVATTATATADPSAPEARGELLFQSCLWCGTPAYRRSFCRACGSTAFRRERSTGAGVLVRRIGQSPVETWFVAMDEGFTLVCRLARAEPTVVGAGSRVRVVRAVTPREQGLPLIEVTYRATSLDRRW